MQNNNIEFLRLRKRKTSFDTNWKRVFVYKKYEEALKKWKDDDKTHTIAKFAEMVGVDDRTVYLWNKEDRIPEPQNIDRIEEVLGTSVSSYGVKGNHCIDDNCLENILFSLKTINLQFGINTRKLVSLVRKLSGISINRSKLHDLVNQEHVCSPECSRCKNRSICCESRKESAGHFRCTVCSNKKCPVYKLEIKPVCCDACKNRSKCIKQDKIAYVLRNIISVLEKCRNINENMDTTVITEGQYNLNWGDRYALVQLVNPMSKIKFIMGGKKIEHKSTVYRKLLNNYAKNKDEIQFLFTHFYDERSVFDALFGGPSV